MPPILFDLDGTLIDCRTRHYTVYSRAVSELGGLPLTERAYWQRRRGGMSTIDLLDATPDVDVRRFTEVWLDRIERPEYLELDAVFDGACEIIEALLPRHQTALITPRRGRQALMCQLESLRLAGYFTTVISCDSPEPQRMKHLLPGVSGLPAGGYVVGDTEADIDFGRRTGRWTVCVGNGVRSGRFLAAHGAETVIRSLRELPEVIRVLERSGEPGTVANADDIRPPGNLYTRTIF